ncbi:MAG TPA: DUF6600 domain-containing protein [Usitatibacter sp.]|nr:DUF6600 domain-containing protein [Usitatibacter sp.]
MRSISLVLLTACAAFSACALAQEPPARVGRLSYVDGPASVYQDADSGWQEALVNTPLTSENSVWTDRSAQAEVQVSASAIRLSSMTQLDISRLDDNELDATVADGRISMRVRYKQPDERYQLSTPGAGFEITRDGLYRLEYDAQSDESRFSVFSGDALMHADNGDVSVGQGQMVVVHGGNASSYELLAAARPDAFDRWVQARDALWHPPRHVSSYMTGYEDLDSYGSWSSDPDYGDVWYPTRVEADWAPYRDGRWGYVEPWGWTWIDAAPWGYAPFHYGRWVYARNRWGWSPGQRMDRPTWAPALVGWFGGANLSSRGPAVGWYPLSPGEHYQPWYRADSRYTSRVNAMVRVAPRDSGNRGEPGRDVNRDHGATVVDRNALLQRKPVREARVPINAQAIRQQPAVSGAQVAQSLPQRNELIRQREDNRTRVPQPAARPAAVASQPRPVSGPGAAPAKAPAAAPATNAFARPDFRHDQAPKPAPAARAPQAAPGAHPVQAAPAAPRTPTPANAPANPPAAANPLARTPAPANAPANAQANPPAAANPPVRFPLAPPASQESQKQQESQRQQEAARRLEEQRQQRQQQQLEQQQRQQQQIQQRQKQEADQRQQQEAQQRQQQQQQQQLQRQQQEAQARERQAREAQQLQQQQKERPPQLQRAPQPPPQPAREKEKEKEKDDKQQR